MRAIVRACLSGALTLTACGGSTEAPKGARAGDAKQAASGTGTDAQESPEAFSRRVHTEALEDLRSLVDVYLARTQPVIYAGAMGTPLTVPYARPSDQRETVAELEQIEKRIGEIRRPALSVADGRRHATWFLMARRDQWHLGRGGPEADDALAYLVRVGDLIREARTRLLVSDGCEDCVQALADLPAQLTVARAAMGSANEANLRAGAARAQALVAELESLRPLLSAAQHATLDQALAGLRTHASDLSSRPLAAGEPRAWTVPGAVAPGGELIPRPAVWGADHLREVFKHEEDYAHEAGTLRDEAEAKLQRFRKMREELQRKSPAEASRGEAAPVDQARCEAIWAPMKAFASSKGGISPRLRCDRVVTWLEGQSLDDNQLADRLLKEGLVEATAHESARSRGGLLAAVGGRWTRELSREYRTVMFAFPLGRQPTGDAALRSLEHRACLATVALEVHSEVTDDALDGWLRTWCPEQKPEAWRAEAVADPRAAFIGIPALLMGIAPAEMVPVVEYGWAMYGVSRELARPEDAPPPEADDEQGKELRFDVEEIDPATF